MLFNTYEEYLAFLKNANETELQDIVRQANGEYLADLQIDLSFSFEWVMVKALRHYQKDNSDIFTTTESFYNLVKTKVETEGITLSDLENYACFIVNYEENIIVTYEYQMDLVEELSDLDIFEDKFLNEEFRLEYTPENIEWVTNQLKALNEDQFLDLANYEFIACAWEDKCVNLLQDYEKVMDRLKAKGLDITKINKDNFNTNDRYFTINYTWGALNSNELALISFNNLSQVSVDLVKCLIECNTPHYIQNAIEKAKLFLGDK